MLLRQLFDEISYTYTYLIADSEGAEAALIDPVFDHVAQYQRLLAELDLSLTAVLETHVHADHITASGHLRELYGCDIVQGENSAVKGEVRRVGGGDTVKVGALSVGILYTPGHTDDSCCFVLETDRQKYLFSGDTLFIRGTGRTDFQNGDAAQQYQSIVGQLFSLGDDTLVYPGHDYNGMTMSTIGEEKRFNPRLSGKSIDEFVELMGNLNLPYPKLIDVAVPANLKLGLNV